MRLEEAVDGPSPENCGRLGASKVWPQFLITWPRGPIFRHGDQSREGELPDKRRYALGETSGERALPRLASNVLQKASPAPNIVRCHLRTSGLPGVGSL